MREQAYAENLRAIPSVLGEDQAAFLVRQRVARLATADGMGKPHAVPVCFALARASIFIALDEKPKDVPVSRLKRVRNILENPEVALIADRYAEAWDLLAFVMVRGRAELLDPGTEEHAAAVRLLRGKYHQYEAMRYRGEPRYRHTSREGRLLGRPRRAGRPLSPRSSTRSMAVAPSGSIWRVVPEDLVERVLEAARWAPSPHGRQPWRFAVLRREETKERLARAMGEEWRANLEMDGQSAEVVEMRLQGSRRRLLEAPVLVLICLYLEDLDAYPDAERQRGEWTMAVQSLGAAAQNALLAAYDSGLDAGWMCAPLFCPERVVEALGSIRARAPRAANAGLR